MAIGSPDKAVRLGQLSSYARCQVWSGYRSDEQVWADVYDAALAEEREQGRAGALADEVIEAARQALDDSSRTWPAKTSYDRLQDAFAELRGHGVVVLEAVDDHWTASETLEHLKVAGRTPRGIAYFTNPDVWHAVEHGMLELNVWHADSANVAPGDSLLDLVLDTLSTHGIGAVFDEGRIEVTVEWQRRCVAVVDRPIVGVLALQGDVREHLAMLTECGAQPVAVRRPAELATVDALVIPGGESTTIVKLAGIFDLLEPIRERLSTGMPALGTCAGMILLADRLLDGTQAQGTFGGLDVAVRRNAFGRQVDSFETEVGFVGFTSPVHAVFIRAPWVEEVGDGVDVLATVTSGPSTGRIVAVRQGRVMATSFHPEISGDARVHRYFVNLVTG